MSYSGVAMGSIFQKGEIPQVEFGTSSLDVNFANGEFRGNLDFSKGKILLNGQAYGASFSGRARLDGEGTGSFQGAFYGKMAKEASGVFGAQSGKTQAVGAFGAKKD